MNLKQQLEVINNIIKELNGKNTINLNILEQNTDNETIIITTGKSIQHIRNIANNIKIEAKRLNIKILGIEGNETGHWVLIDLLEIVVHIMTEKTREFYKLEKLWSELKNT
ncbi:ribosome silencing factor [Candidatus Vesicomyidisocius sp. SY067_SCS001]|uniref:ribosome silencing factor n=1 Tax=Candidatus Vesicomyidisocius sp. SY067_SCS001 TaxID=2732590 RepID=UPI0016827E9B|nr:ribosome silencing factor [Candidatus Vesicomyosocius sp. SY067_SCS001]